MKIKNLVANNDFSSSLSAKEVRYLKDQWKSLNLNSVEPSTTNIFGEDYLWKSFDYKQKSPFITESALLDALLQFFKFYRSQPHSKFFAVMFKIKLKSGAFRTCGVAQISDTSFESLQTLFMVFSNIFSSETFAEDISETWEDYNDRLKNSQFVGNIIFNYKYLQNVTETKFNKTSLMAVDNKKHVEAKNLMIKRTIEDKAKMFSFKKGWIPRTMDLEQWPHCSFYKNTAFSHFIKEGKNQTSQKFSFTFEYDLKDNYKFNPYAEIRGQALQNGVKMFSFVDKPLSDSFDHFTREVVKSHSVIGEELSERLKQRVYNIEKFTFLKEEVVDYEIKLNVIPFLSSLKAKPAPKQLKILTLDFETKLTYIPGKGKLTVPIAISMYDNIRNQNRFQIFENPQTWNEDLKVFLKEKLCRRMYTGYKIYIQNMSKFDYFFLIDALTDIGVVKIPMKRDNNILKISFAYKTPDLKKPVTMAFYDSKLILSASQADLSKKFKIENVKDIFPYTLANNPDFSFDYEGQVPDKKYFADNVTEIQYQEYRDKYSGRNWNFRQELELYANRDTKGLAEIISIFHEKIYSVLRVDITRLPTLPSIAFAGFRTNYTLEETIPLINNKHFQYLKEAYYGGIAENYKPQTKSGVDVKSYDVNSLYPAMMREKLFPVGTPRYFKGKRRLEDLFGFVRVKITSPEQHKPTLPYKITTKEGGKRTIYPTGTWEGLYFTEELKDKLQDGYKFEVLEGYLFQKGELFKDYIDSLYKIKSETDSSDPLYHIAKLLMNALYGRFGLNPETEKVEICDSEMSENILKSKERVKVKPLLSGKAILTYTEPEDNELDDTLKIANISVPVSAAIAAYSRVELSKYIREYDEHVYAVDTDGVKTDKDFDLEYIDSKKLGKMKYEYTLIEGVFILPKVYGGILDKPYKGNSTELVKVKGVKQSVKYSDLKQLLKRGATLKFLEERWIKRVEESTIIVKNVDYHLSLNESKRVAIFDDDGNFIDTRPHRVKEGEIIL